MVGQTVNIAVSDVFLLPDTDGEYGVSSSHAVFEIEARCHLLPAAGFFFAGMKATAESPSPGGMRRRQPSSPLGEKAAAKRPDEGDSEAAISVP
jgi:hypothetical protein